MALWRKIVGATGANRSRLHDQRGVAVPSSRLLRNGPRALATGIARLAFGVRPRRPWISYDAARVLAHRLGPGSRMLEYGSGASTAWFARHAGELVSLEHDPDWHATTAAALSGVPNARLRLVTDLATYPDLSAAEVGDGFDVILIDGWARPYCALAAMHLLRPGGVIYLDNADRENPAGSALPPSRDILQAFADKQGASVEWFVDFAPTLLFVQAGVLVTMPADVGTIAR